MVPDYEFTAVFLDPAWGEANRPAVTGFLRALRRGQTAMAPIRMTPRRCW